MPVDKFGRMSDTKTKDTGVSLTYINDNYVRSDGKTPLTGSLDMRGNTIYNVADPVNPQDVVTKVYVDTTTKNLFIDENDNIAIGLNIDMEGNKIFSLPEPEQDNEPATKEYVDEAIKGLAGGDLLVSKEGVFIKANGHYRATAPLDLDNHKMENLPYPVDDKDAVNKKYVDGIVENLTLKQGLIRENGGFNLVDSYINMNFNNIRNVGLPKNEEDAVPRRFVDGEIRAVEEKIQKIKEKSEERPFFKENGNYQASTSINMNFNKLLNLQKPTEPYDAATKDYVDYVEKKIEEKLVKKPHLITVHARYCGPLKRGEYQFKFNGGGNLKGCDESLGKYKDFKGSITGFVIPHSGHIKKIICEGLIFKNINDVAEFVFNYISDNEKDLLLSDISLIVDTGYYTDIKDIIEKGIDELKKKLSKTRANISGLNFNFNSIGFIKFEIVKFEKSLNPKDYPTLKTQPKITSSVLIKKFKTVFLNFTDENVFYGNIFKKVNNDYVALSEGDVINIKSMFDFVEEEEYINLSKSLIFELETIKYLLSSASYNFTFLIELDPL